MTKPKKGIRKIPRTTMEVRIDEVMAKMIACTWSAKEFRDTARRWGVSDTVVKNVAAEASRTIRRHADIDPEEIRTKVLAGVEFIIAQCHKSKNWNGMLKGMDILCKAYGVYAPIEHNVTGELAGMSDDAMENRRQALLARISAEQPEVH